MSMAWAPDPSTACVSEPSASTWEWRPATATVASASSSSTTSSDALSLRRRQSPPRGDPATTRRARRHPQIQGARHALDAGAAGLHDGSQRPGHPPTPRAGHRSPRRRRRAADSRAARAGRPPCQVPKREPSASDDDEHVALAPDAVRAVHDDQRRRPPGRPRPRRPGTRTARARRARRRRARRAGGRPRPGPAGRPPPPRGSGVGSRVSPISATKRLLAEVLERLVPARAGPVVLHRPGVRPVDGGVERAEPALVVGAAHAAGASMPAITAVGAALEQPVELVEPLLGPRPARVLGPVDDALMVGGGPVRGHPGRLAGGEPDRRVVRVAGRRA